MSVNPEQEIGRVTITEEEYLTTELTSEVKREYINGEVYAMAGAGYNHNCICVNLVTAFNSHLGDTKCRTFVADMKVRLGKDYVYPDVLVQCNEIDNIDYYATSPVIIVEVLSKSTKKRDLTQKLIRYINLPSLQEYVMIEQDTVLVQVLRRSNGWITESFFLEDSVTFASIDLTMTVEDIYKHVNNDDMREFRLKLSPKYKKKPKER
jgi:Uma2 family endonuclease